MRNEGFTPGPWYIRGTTVYALKARDFNRFCAHVQDWHTPIAELEANARLIAAAPDLLAALSSLIEKAYKQDWNEHYPEQLTAAEAAIAKARGEA